jgi:predicted Zn-dependent protease
MHRLYCRQVILKIYTFMKFQFGPIVLFSLVSLLLISSCARNPVTGKREVMLMTENQEIALGKESDPSIVAQYGLYEDATLQAFINEKGREMAAISHRPNLPYEFKILDSPVVNAFAVPGGYVYFTRGILAHFNNEAEFAGVLGHEIGHITARHSAKQYSKQMLLQGLFIGGMIVSEDFRNFADVASQGLGLLFLKFGRDAESQSDQLGVEYSTTIGYDAVKMANFFNTLNRMTEASGQSIPTFLSTHPNPADRFQNVQSMAKEKQSPGKNYQVNRDKYLRMIDGLVYGEDPRQGFVEDQVFYHPELAFQFKIPQNWQYQNSPTQFQMAEVNGRAMMVLGLENAQSLQAAQSAIIERNQLTVIDQSQVRVNGLDAIAMISEQVPLSTGQQASGQAASLKLLTYIIQYGANIYKIHGVSSKDDFNQFFPIFKATMTDFSKLTDADKLNRQPTRIKIVSVKNSTSLTNALRSFDSSPEDLEKLYLLNGMTANENVTQGSLIKIFDKSGQYTPPPKQKSSERQGNRRALKIK